MRPKPRVKPRLYRVGKARVSRAFFMPGFSLGSCAQKHGATVADVVLGKLSGAVCLALVKGKARQRQQFALRHMAGQAQFFVGGGLIRRDHGGQKFLHGVFKLVEALVFAVLRLGGQPSGTIGEIAGEGGRGRRQGMSRSTEAERAQKGAHDGKGYAGLPVDNSAGSLCHGLTMS